MDAILQPILESPSFPEYCAELNGALKAERERRHRFREELDETVKAEFINGEVFVHSPNQARHVRVRKFIASLLDAHVRKRRLGEVFDEKALVEFPRNDYEPDVIFFRSEKAAQIVGDTFFFPIPDLIVEVLSPSTEKNDRKIKFQDYARHGVEEYWIVEPKRCTIEQYLLEGARYPSALPRREGMLQSHAIAGFSVPITSLFDEAENADAVMKLWTGTA